jgi:hypothetical protein
MQVEVLINDDEVSGSYTFIFPRPDLGGEDTWRIEWSESDEAELTNPAGETTILALFHEDAGALMQLVEQIAQATDQTP